VLCAVHCLRPGAQSFVAKLYGCSRLKLTKVQYELRSLGVQRQYGGTRTVLSEEISAAWAVRVNYGLNSSSEKDQGRSKMDTTRNPREPRGEWMRMRSRREPSLYTASICPQAYNSDWYRKCSRLSNDDHLSLVQSICPFVQSLLKRRITTNMVKVECASSNTWAVLQFPCVIITTTETLRRSVHEGQGLHSV
jgi:hypothetical protein